ncbi:MAG: tRNA 2-thiouridine(34) synthase MnmA [Clostridia bacterium]|nr:tRNA 2-thiouridine(34) synthase MnmA [Clostridia bacterium]
MPKVMVAMSGGVDSSVAAARLLEQGYEVIGATLRLYERQGNAAEAEKAKAVCERLNIPHFCFDMRELFSQKVIKKFALDYDLGLTPNPCIECNIHLKFGALFDKAMEMGCDFLATGHYCKVKNGELIRPADRKKDQTYVLWHLTKEKLEHILMPLGDITKDEVKKIAAQYGFESATGKESQDICFVIDGDYAAFLESYNGKKFAKGTYVDIGGKVLGENAGHQCYTVGQRKGLGIALGCPHFVISKDAKNNTVVLSPDEKMLFKTKVYIRDISVISGEIPTKPFACTAKLRYSAPDTECTVYPEKNKTAVIEFVSPVRAPSPGQSAVFYDGNKVLGGGIIV